jgi:hypothetical protein
MQDAFYASKGCFPQPFWALMKSYWDLNARCILCFLPKGCFPQPLWALMESYWDLNARCILYFLPKGCFPHPFWALMDCFLHTVPLWGNLCWRNTLLLPLMVLHRLISFYCDVLGMAFPCRSSLFLPLGFEIGAPSFGPVFLGECSWCSFLCLNMNQETSFLASFSFQSYLGLWSHLGLVRTFWCAFLTSGLLQMVGISWGLEDTPFHGKCPFR